MSMRSSVSNLVRGSNIIYYYASYILYVALIENYIIFFKCVIENYIIFSA